MRLYSSWVPPNRDCDIFRELGIGILFTPKANRTPLYGIPWILDNGAYGAWIRKSKFDSYAFLGALRKIPRDRPPDFIVIPDIVTAGKASLKFSLRWLPRLENNCPAQEKYLAVQDGMDVIDIGPLLEERIGIDGIFVGGSIEWKLETSRLWIELAHSHGKPVHIGRCGTLERIRWAKNITADSIDSGSWARNGEWRTNLVNAALASKEDTRKE